MKRRVIACVLSVLMLCSLMSACGQESAKPAAAAPAAEAPVPAAEASAQPAQKDCPAEREYTDDTGRTVVIPAEIRTIAVSGPLTQVYTMPLCLDMYAGVCTAYSADAARYLDETFMKLPELGQLYGGKGTMDLEALLAADPDIVLDVGEAKGSLRDDFDALTEQTGIPFIHIDATVSTAADSYRRLGALLGREEKAEELASFLEAVLSDIEGIMAKVDAAGERKTLAYLLGDKGLNALASASFHAETLNIVAVNVVEVQDVVSSGAGNEIDMEQLMLWDPEYIIFDATSIYDRVKTDEAWQQLSAIKNGKVFETPYGPYGWLASPPSVQRYLGMLWLTSLLYPDYADYDLQEKVCEYYSIFYGYELSADDYAELMKNAI